MTNVVFIAIIISEPSNFCRNSAFCGFRSRSVRDLASQNRSIPQRKEAFAKAKAVVINMADKNNVWNGYADLLKKWVVFSQKHLYILPENKNLICYGAGEHGHWGTHTHQKAFSAFAVAAALDEIDWADTPLTREQVLYQALGMLRYTLYTHVSMDQVCTDGGKWGHNWIYALGIERMYHGIEAIEEHLTEDDREKIKAIILSECEFLFNEYTIKAGLFVPPKSSPMWSENIQNNPESNIWNGAIIYRALALYDDMPNREAYLDKARRFFANGISIPSDENSDETVDGQKIKDLFIGANMFESYSCNHHGYLNVGYMVICLSNIAMLHFFLKGKNKKADDMIYRHLKEQWKLINTCTFDDGRLLRIGGDSRARYCYCQDYALPMWALIEDVFGEDCSGKEDGWLKILQAESCANGDGSFLSNRFGQFEERSPVYYTRLESDRANVISMYLYWHSRYGLSCNGASERLASWEDEFHGASMNVGENRYASFVWRAAELPQGMLLPKNDSSFAEWRYNLAGHIEGVGRKNEDGYVSSAAKSFEGGFLSWGSTISYSDDFMAEGQQRDNMARKYVAFAALPDDSTVLCLQYAKSLNRTFISKIRGILWNVPNDIFNHCTRTLFTENNTCQLQGGANADQYETREVGFFANFDEKIGIASNAPLTLVRSGERQVVIKGRENSGTLYAEEICSPYISRPQWYDRDETLIDVGFAVSLGDHNATLKMKESLIEPKLFGLRAIGVTAKDGKKYILVANFDSCERSFDSKALDLGECVNVATGEKADICLLEAGAAVLLMGC